MTQKVLAKGLSMLKKTALFPLCAIFVVSCALASACAPAKAQHSGLLRDIYADYFKVGAATSYADLKYDEKLLENYNSVTSTYEMKWGAIERRQGSFDYRSADNLLSWAAENDVAVRGHCLVWYRNVPDWVANKTDKESVLALMEEHITRTMTHFGDDVVYCWDVVNEALHDSVTAEQLESGNIYRNAVDDERHFERDGVFDWYSVCGEDYVEEAFRTAAKVCEDEGYSRMKLFYNDYLLNMPLKREACVKLVTGLREKGVRVDGIGMQAHYALSSYTADKKGWINDFEEAIKAYTGLGLEVHITELDIDTGEEVLFEESERLQAEMYGAIFDVCRKYSRPWREGAGSVTSVTTWGVKDGKNNCKYLFDASGNPKAAFDSVTYF